MFNEGSSPTVTDCTFSGNSAGSYGGGMANSDSSPTVTNCTFLVNSASPNGGGGGMFNELSSSPIVANCTFSGNTASHNGGGMYNVDSSPTVTNCTFSGNSASYSSGGGMFNHAGSSPAVSNCIFWGDSPDEISDSISEPAITYSDIQGGYSGEGNINANPLFVDAAGGDLHLRLFSPAIDAGNNAAPDLPLYDFEGDARIVDGNHDGIATVDMGVDEFLPVLYLPLMMR